MKEDVYEKAARLMRERDEAAEAREKQRANMEEYGKAEPMNTGDAFCHYAEEAVPPQPRTPPQILAQHAEEHRLLGLQLRAEGLSLIERSLKHLAVAGEFEHARSRIID